MVATVFIYILFCLFAYLFGSLNFAVLISKLKGRDIRKLGSGNPGTMNMRRQFGFGIAFLTMTLDVLKGVIPCIVGWWLLGNRWQLDYNHLGIYVGGAAAIVGHIFPVFYKFRGGKGVATSIGIGLVINPVLTIVLFVAGFIFMAISHMGSITSFFVISPPLIWELYRLSGSGGVYGYIVAGQILLMFLLCLTIWAHRGNVVKLFMGTESKTRVFNSKKEKLIK